MDRGFVCFGELLLRLAAPGHELLLQTPRFEVQVGGAEANVAVQLARLDHGVRMVGTLPANALGEAARGELRRHGVDVRHVRSGPGRMGLYFLATGAGHRPSEVLYDRADSAFARASPDAYDWPAAFAGASHFHVSGVTPAVGPNGAAVAIAAVRAARAQGMHVSFDGNFRAKLWQAWEGDARAILRAIIEQADLVFADHRDMALVLGRSFDDAAPERVHADAARAAFEAFPNLQRMASTLRTQHSVDQHELAAVMLTRASAITLPAQSITRIVDRIGTGDAFAAGVLHGLALDRGDEQSLQLGLAAACLKHAMPGDFGLATREDLEAFVGERRFDVRR